MNFPNFEATSLKIELYYVPDNVDNIVDQIWSYDYGIFQN